jgi:hypothetical protein
MESQRREASDRARWEIRMSPKRKILYLGYWIVFRQCAMGFCQGLG